MNRSRHRQQLQGQHLFSGSSINSRRVAPNDHFQNPKQIPINSFNTTNNTNNNNDILPAVGLYMFVLLSILSYTLGEIVLWDNKDQGGYTNNNQGEWAKIDGRQWFGNSLLKSCSKTSLSKRFIFKLNKTKI